MCITGFEPCTYRRVFIIMKAILYFIILVIIVFFNSLFYQSLSSVRRYSVQFYQPTYIHTNICLPIHHQANRGQGTDNSETIP
jgi:hypothetical protein